MIRQGLSSVIFSLVGLTFGSEGKTALPPRFLFVGDILLSRNVAKEMQSNPGSPWKSFDSLFKNSDWVMGNLEGAVGLPKDCPIERSGPCFPVPESLITFLKRAGFTALGNANNHASDLEESGKRATRKSLYENQLVDLDYDSSPFFRTIEGHEIAFIALSLIPDKEGKSQSVPSLSLSQKLRLARNFSERIVIFIHWGSELQDWPNGEQMRVAHWLIGHGADLILGAHPHVIQTPECVEGKPVFYSLGNHLFDQKYLETKQGMLADCSLLPAGFSCHSLRTVSSLDDFYPRLNVDSRADTKASVCPDSVTGISKEQGPLRLENLQKDDTTSYQWSYSSASNIHWKSHSSELLSAAIFHLRKHHGKDFLFCLEKHFSNLDHETGARPYVYELTSNGVVARWRGSGLAWPLLDATPLPDNNDGIFCALHRNDSFLAPNPSVTATRNAAYQWNGFGFSLIRDSTLSARCKVALE